MIRLNVLPAKAFSGLLYKVGANLQLEKFFFGLENLICLELITTWKLTIRQRKTLCPWKIFLSVNQRQKSEDTTSSFHRMLTLFLSINACNL